MDVIAYPINDDWSTNEIIVVHNFLKAVEEAYEQGVPLAQFQTSYLAYKGVVTSLGEERRLSRQFEALSGSSPFLVVREMKRLQEQGASDNTRIRLTP